MTQKNIWRAYTFPTGDPKLIGKANLYWVTETGGTIITHKKRVFEKYFGLRNKKEMQKFEMRNRVQLIVIRQNPYVVKGKKALLMYLNREDLARFEHLLDMDYSDSKIKQVLVLAENEDDIKDWVWHYDANLLGDAPEGWTEALAAYKKFEKLPTEIDKILQYLADAAKDHHNTLRQHELDRLKADLMRKWNAWENVTEHQVKGRCYELKMSLADTDIIVDLLHQRRQGAEFQIEKNIRSFRRSQSGIA